MFLEVYTAVLGLCISVFKNSDCFDDPNKILDSLEDLPIYPKFHFSLTAYNEQTL